MDCKKEALWAAHQPFGFLNFLKAVLQPQYFIYMGLLRQIVD